MKYLVEDNIICVKYLRTTFYVWNILLRTTLYVWNISWRTTLNIWIFCGGQHYMYEISCGGLHYYMCQISGGRKYHQRKYLVDHDSRSVMYICTITHISSLCVAWRCKYWQNIMKGYYTGARDWGVNELAPPSSTCHRQDLSFPICSSKTGR